MDMVPNGAYTNASMMNKSHQLNFLPSYSQQKCYAVVKPIWRNTDRSRESYSSLQASKP